MVSAGIAHLAVVFFGAAGDAALPLEHPTPYRLGFEAVCSALPQPTREFVLLRRAAIEDALECRPSADGQAGANEPAAHYLLLDFAAAEGDAAARMDAATRFPRAKKEVQKLHEKHGARAVGDLPWAIEDRQAALRKSLAAGDWANAERHIGGIIHLSIDAALPFNTTTLAGDELRPTRPGDDEAAPALPRRLRERFHGAIVTHLAERLAYEVRVSPVRVHTVASPADAAFEVLLQAHAAAQELAAIDVEAIREQGADDVATFASSADIYSAALMERAAPILENQIESGALLAASLIHSAWIKARPAFPETAPSVPTIAPATGATPAAAGAAHSGSNEAAKASPTGGAGFVGSLGSTVYHRPDCSHVARIKVENRVGFKTRAEAESAGRKPCRACKPEVESPPPRHEDTK